MALFKGNGFNTGFQYGEVSCDNFMARYENTLPKICCAKPLITIKQGSIRTLFFKNNTGFNIVVAGYPRQLLVNQKRQSVGGRVNAKYNGVTGVYTMELSGANDYSWIKENMYIKGGPDSITDTYYVSSILSRNPDSSVNYNAVPFIIQLSNTLGTPFLPFDTYCTLTEFKLVTLFKLLDGDAISFDPKISLMSIEAGDEFWVYPDDGQAVTRTPNAIRAYVYSE